MTEKDFFGSGTVVDAATDKDVEDFEYLDQKGCHIYHQMVPSEPKEDFMEMIK